MSQATAMAEAKRLKACMEARGVKCSIELQVGRPYSGDDWYTRKYFRMHHHTVSRPSNGLTPCLGLIKRGRSDLPGPLSNGYGGYDRVYRIITMGLANHPGAGGPFTADGYTLPKDSARISSWGTEFEGGIESWSSDMWEFMGRADCALMDWMGRPVTSQLEHSTWTPRKSDRLRTSRTQGIALTRKWDPISKPVQGGGKPVPPGTDTEEDPMAGLTKADLQDAFEKALDVKLQKFITGPGGDNDHDEQVLSWQAPMQSYSDARMAELHAQGVSYADAVRTIQAELFSIARPLWSA